MASVVKYAFRYDGVKFFGGHAIAVLKEYARCYGIEWDIALPTWKRAIAVFERLPDYGKRLVVVREHHRSRRSRLKYLRRKAIVE